MTPSDGTDFRLMIREAQPHERRQIEARNPDGVLASDHCIAVWLDADLIGWGDDYGTFHPLRGWDRVTEAAERFLEAASDVWEASVL